MPTNMVFSRAEQVNELPVRFGLSLATDWCSRGKPPTGFIGAGCRHWSTWRFPLHLRLALFDCPSQVTSFCARYPAPAPEFYLSHALGQSLIGLKRNADQCSASGSRTDSGYANSSAAIACPAMNPVVHADWKLKPPVIPSMSRTSPPK